MAANDGHGGASDAGRLGRAKGLAPSYVSGILRLTLLAPDIVEAILGGRQPAELQLDELLTGIPLEWEVQACRLGIKDPRTLIVGAAAEPTLDGSPGANFCTADYSAGRT